MAWLGTWANRLKITISNTNVDSALTDFPILVKLSVASGIGDVDVSAIFDELGSDANRKKIAVTSSDGATQLYCEIERFDYANEEAWLHVKVPSVSSSAGTILYLYYDSTQADNTTYVGDTTDAVTHNVWDSGFKAVYHMAQDPSGGSGAIKDSTVNANDGTPNGSMTTADLVDGQVGKGINFDGVDDYINLPSISLSTDKTLEVLLKSDAVESEKEIVLSVNSLGNYGEGCLGISSVSWNWRDSDTQGKEYLSSATGLLNETDYYLGFARDGSGSDLYRNGVSDVSGGVNIYGPGDIKYIGYAITTANRTFFDGIISEVRISSTARSAAWIKATYHSLWDSLVTFEFEDVTVQAITTNLTLTENSATVSYDLDIQANTTNLALTEYPADVSWGINVNANTVNLTLTAHPVTITHNVNVLANCAALSITAYPASLNIPASCQALSLSTYPADIFYGTLVVSNTTTLNITTYRANIPENIVCSVASLQMCPPNCGEEPGPTATIKYDVNIFANVASLALIAHDAEVRYRITSTIDLINSLQLGSTIDLVNSLNQRINGDINIINSILQRLEGELNLVMDIEERTKVFGTLDLLNRILDLGDGVTQNNYEFSKGHGL